METNATILKLEKDGEDGLIVTFSDGTATGYVVEELLMLRPQREHVPNFLRQPQLLQA